MNYDSDWVDINDQIAPVQTKILLQISFQIPAQLNFVSQLNVGGSSINFRWSINGIWQGIKIMYLE